MSDGKISALTPGRIIDQIANRLASLRSKLARVDRKNLGGALTGRMRFYQEREHELERLCADLGSDVKMRVEERVEILLRPDDED